MIGIERRGGGGANRRRALFASARRRTLPPLLFLAGLATLIACGDRQSEPGAPVARRAPAPEARRLELTPPTPAGRPVPPGDPQSVAAAAAFLREPVNTEPCGPYSLVTEAGAQRRGAWASLCATVAERFEAEYAGRLGVPIHHPPAGTIILFADRGRFRAYAASDPALPAGYAGFSLAGRGLVALPAGDVSAAEMARTLAHELAHLAHRRAFGGELPPWLAEGLADAVGDSAGPGGFAALSGFTGVEGIRRRLVLGYRSGRVGLLERLVALDRDRFDRDAVSHDYEQSALFVRFLLLETALAPRFRDWLAAQTSRGESLPPDLTTALASNWTELERRFRDWLEPGLGAGGPPQRRNS